MAPDDPALVRTWYEAFADADAQRIRGFVAPEVEFHNPDDAIEPGIHRGVDAFVGVVERLHDIFEFSRADPERFERVGNQIVVEFRAAGRARTSGAPIESVFGHVWTLRDDGTVIRMAWFRSYDQALASAGSPSGHDRPE